MVRLLPPRLTRLATDCRYGLCNFCPDHHRRVFLAPLPEVCEGLRGAAQRQGTRSVGAHVDRVGGAERRDPPDGTLARDLGQGDRGGARVQRGAAARGTLLALDDLAQADLGDLARVVRELADRLP